MSDTWTHSLAKIVSQSKVGSKVFLFIEEVSSVTGIRIPIKDTLSHLKYLGITLILDTGYSLGLTDEYPIDENIIYVGGFGFAIPGAGGFIVGDERVEAVKKRSKVLASEVPLPPYLASYASNYSRTLT